MDRTEFERRLKSDGYSQIETKDYAQHPANEPHGHDFAVRGLVLEGAFTVLQGNQSVTYRRVRSSPSKVSRTAKKLGLKARAFSLAANT